MANAALAFAPIQNEAPKLLTAIEARSVWRVEHGSTQNVGDTVWAFATLKIEAPTLLAAIEARLAGRKTKQYASGSGQHCVGFCKAQNGGTKVVLCD